MHEKCIYVLMRVPGQTGRCLPQVTTTLSRPLLSGGQKGRGVGLPAKSQGGVSRKASPNTEEGEKLGRQRRRWRHPRSQGPLYHFPVSLYLKRSDGACGLSNQQALVPDLPPPICVAFPALCLSLLTGKMEIMTTLTSQDLKQVGAGEPGHRASPATVRQDPQSPHALKL